MRIEVYIPLPPVVIAVKAIHEDGPPLPNFLITAIHRHQATVEHVEFFQSHFFACRRHLQYNLLGCVRRSNMTYPPNPTIIMNTNNAYISV
jgi:hypothetical protein